MRETEGTLLYSHLLRPFLFRCDPEFAHDLTLQTLHYLGPALALVEPFVNLADPLLETECLGLRFRNPIGLAAGLDKNGKALHAWKHLGFGFAEIGTITPRAQPGNPRPRLFRLRTHQAIINRMGFNNEGSGSLKRRLQDLQRWSAFPIGINVGRNKLTMNESAIEDYRSVIEDQYDIGDYFVVNVSSPNTESLRELQAAKAIGTIVGAITEHVQSLARNRSAAAKAVLVKIAPDLLPESLDLTVEACVRAGANGIIAVNTTVKRDLVTSSPHARESGGLSGDPLRSLTLAAVEQIHRRYGSGLPIIGVGGVMCPEDAYNLILAGASLVQIYTGLIYQGPGLVHRTVRYVRDRLKADGFHSMREAVGAAIH